jgi:hypothetical protein
MQLVAVTSTYTAKVYAVRQRLLSAAVYERARNSSATTNQL